MSIASIASKEKKILQQSNELKEKTKKHSHKIENLSALFSGFDSVKNKTDNTEFLKLAGSVKMGNMSSKEIDKIVYGL